MIRTVPRARRALLGVFAVTAAGGAAALALALPGGPEATAATDPCAASEIAKTIGSVATSTGTYLDAHPQTNTALTTIAQQQGGPQSLAALKTYFDANPDAAKDMQQLQSPLMNLSSKCKLPVTLPQLMGLMQAAQTQAPALQAGTPSSLPGSLPTAQTVGVPGVVAPSAQVPATAARQGTGPLPGPVTAATG
jgi:heme-binding protein